MSLFLKAAEVWVPDLDNLHLVLASAEYGNLQEFSQGSAEIRFARGEGLPGETWSKQRPMIWSDLQSSHFLRKEQAEKSGISCGLSIPITSGEFLLAIVVLFFGGSNNSAGAVEVWSNSNNPNSSELKLTDGFYGDLERFEWVSRRLTLMRGHGLPGTAWDLDCPYILGNLAESSTFLRARNAAECGITTGMAIPFNFINDEVHIVTLLSASGSPIAEKFEIWAPDSIHQNLVFNSGFNKDGDDLSSQYTDKVLNKQEGAVARMWITGRPVLKRENHHRELLIPVIRRSVLTSMVRFVF